MPPSPPSLQPSVRISDPPNDVISRVRLSKENDDLLLATSWDSTVRLYNISSDSLLSSQPTPSAALDGLFFEKGGGSGKRYAIGTLDGSVYIGDFGRSSLHPLGSHLLGVRCVASVPERDLIFSGSWDKTIKAWDMRTMSEAQTASVSGKVFAMDCSDKSNKMVVCDSLKTVTVFDLRNLSQPESIRDVNQAVLKHQFRTVECFPDGQGYVAASVEGRVAWEYFTEGAGGKKSYAFKCHREKVDGIENIFPVNCLAFHPVYGTFATGGGEGGVSIWDGCNKKRIWKVAKPFDSSVSSLSFSKGGDRLAVGVSNENNSNLGGNDIFVRSLRDEDVKPKSPK